jgi:hypothetical protein
VIDASADFLAGTKRILGVPLLYFFMTILFLIFWLTAMISVASIGNITGSNSTFPQMITVDETDPKVERTKTILFWYMIFGVLWVTAFLRAQSTFITMVSACTYYFNSSKDAPEDKQEGEAEVGLAFKFAYMYHIGSLAMGSFIIAMI